MTQAQTTARWCQRCGQPVRLEGGDGVPDELRRAVHAATGQEMGDYGHLAAPVGCEPPHWKSCRVLTAEFGDAFVIEAWFTFLRADWADLPPGTVAGHFEADGEEEMRLRLKAAVAARRDAGR